MIRELLGSTSSKPKVLPPKAKPRKIPDEVTTAFANYERAKLELENFRQEHAAVITEYEERLAAEERTLKGVKTLYEIYKDILGKSYNGFHVQERRSIDAHLLVELFPDAIAFVKFALPVEEFDKYMKEGLVPEDVADQVVTTAEIIAAPRRAKKRKKSATSSDEQEGNDE